MKSIQNIKVGTLIKLQRRYSEMNGWSIRPDLDGKIVEVVSFEDRPNGSITAIMPGEPGQLCFFRDAVAHVVSMEDGELK